MSGKRLLIFGASGHAREIMQTASWLGYEEYAMVSRDGHSDTSECPVYNLDEAPWDRFENWDCIVGIGDNARRRYYQESYHELKWVNLIAPSAVLGDHCKLGKGIFIGAGVYVGPNSSIGDGCLLHVGSLVGHDGQLGDFSQLAPRASMLGCVRLESEVYVGAHACIRQGTREVPLTIARGVHIGMGCMVMDAIAEPGVRLVPKPNHLGLR